MKNIIKKQKLLLFFLGVAIFLSTLFFDVKLSFAATTYYQDAQCSNKCASGGVCEFAGSFQGYYCKDTNASSIGRSFVGTNSDSECQKECTDGICVNMGMAGIQCQAKVTPSTPEPKHFDYILLEGLPGFYNAKTSLTDLPAMILAIYKFGIWTVGIAGFFMLVVGGFMYIASAGNTSTANNANKIIWDAVLGIVAALGAYLILYVINPELTKINISFSTVNVEEIGPGPSTSGSGNCKPITDNNNSCSVDNLKKFAESKGMTSGAEDWATKASSICNAESSGKATAESGGKCNGTPIAYGLFQVNLNAHCDGAFTSKWKKSAGFTNGGCSVANQNIFNACKANATNVNWNLNKMWSLYKARGWQPWEVTLNGMCPKW